MKYHTAKLFSFVLALITFAVIMRFTRILSRQIVSSTSLQKRALENNEDFGQSNNNTEHLVFCKNPTIHEFPEDFLPFKETSKYISEHGDIFYENYTDLMQTNF